MLSSQEREETVKMIIPFSFIIRSVVVLPKAVFVVFRRKNFSEEEEKKRKKSTKKAGERRAFQVALNGKRKDTKCENAFFEQLFVAFTENSSYAFYIL